MDKYFYEQGSNTPYRRVSSKSSIWGNNEPGLTYWRWYWEKADDEWEEYHTWVIYIYFFNSPNQANCSSTEMFVTSKLIIEASTKCPIAQN